MKSNKIKRGQAISFRVPSDTPDHIIKQLQKLKETERRNFSSKIASFVLQGVGQTLSKERETITIPFPHRLSESQRAWSKHEHSEALLGSIVYHLLTDPIRATALLASLNSNSTDINDALYLQEEGIKTTEKADVLEEIAVAEDVDDIDELDSVKWEDFRKQEPVNNESEPDENDLDSLLGDFLSKMNK